jgi:LssY-like putative type I secretion system component LssY
MTCKFTRIDCKGGQTEWRKKTDSEDGRSILPKRRAIPIEFSFLAFLIFLFSLALSAQDLPPGTALEARLSVATSSRSSHAGEPIEATIIAPVSIQGRILVPQGSRLLGSIANATAIGFGLKHSRASIAYSFDVLELPSGTRVPIKAQLVEVETAKEHVDNLGTVRGIHPIVSLSSSWTYGAAPLLLVDPPIGAPLLGMKFLVAPSPNPEIVFPTGTEIILRLTAPVSLPPNADFSVPSKSFSQGDLGDIAHLMKNSGQRAYIGNRTSDIVNVLLIGSPNQMERAFHAAGWSLANRKSPLSLFRMYYALAKRFGYPRAPMNALTLNGVPSAFVHQKTLDTVERRHHVRLWQYPQKENVWLGASAEDIGFRFELTHWTHFTDPNIDNERAKIVNDLAFTGCVNAVGLLSRPASELGQDPKAAHPILTDGNIAVIQLNDCIRPNVMPGVSEISALQTRGRLARALRGFRDDFVRSNILFTTYNTLKLIKKHRSEPTPVEGRFVNGAPRGLDWFPPMASLETHLEQ